MQLKKYIIAIVVIALFYLGISYILSTFFEREFNFGMRLIAAVAFGIIIMLYQFYLDKNLKKRKRRK